MNIESVKEKIRKLLALACDPGAAEQEAETAGRQAAKLMAKYELDEYEVQGDKEAIHDFDLTSGEAQGTRPGKRNATEVPLWIRLIAVGVGRYTGSRLTVLTSSVKFSGRRTDVELAVWLHNTLVTQCYEQGGKETSGQGLSAASAWRNGYAATIQRRLRAMRDDREAEEQHIRSESGTSLMVVRESLEQAMVQAFGAPPKTQKVSVRMSGEGQAAGRSAHIPQHRPIGA